MSCLAAGTGIRSTLLLAAAALPLLFGATGAAAICVGDCGGDGRVGIADVQACVNLAHDLAGIACPNADQNGDGTVDVVDVDNCILSFLDASTCPQVAATPTPPPSTNTPVSTATPVSTNTPLATSTATPIPTATRTNTPVPSPTPTDTVAPVCPIEPGSYTITQLAGGTLSVSIFPAFPFPAGGSIVQDVGPGDADCVHSTVIPMGGFSAPIFCIPALGLYTEIQQTGCGIGRIDSNGGSDFTVNEKGDTSDASPTCNLPQATCTNGLDSSIRVDVTVGNGVADTCTGNGTANAIVAVPVFTRTWSDASGGSAIPPCAGDAVFNGTDTIITQFPQILDFTTDATVATFVDLDGNGCSKAGLEGAAGKAGTGACLNIAAGTISTAAAGTIGSAGAPTYDLTFSSVLLNSISGPAPSMGATCPSPPTINFNGLATRCIQ
ncbi:MAG: hypothetical protein ACRERC_20290 [Candidatus Binatia bacterium]